MEPQKNETQEVVNDYHNSAAEKKVTLSLPAAVLTGFALIALSIILVVPGMKKAAPTTETPTAEAPGTPTSVPASVATVRADDHVKGDAAVAEVLIFTYSDSDCPFCARFHPTMQSVLTDYKGKVAWVYRQFPLDMHPNAYTESLALECVATLKGDIAFFSYLDTVVNTTLSPDPESNEALIAFAQKQGIDSTAFKTCLADQSLATKIDASINEANDIGARGTPFSIAVNKKTGEQTIIPGAYPIEKMKEIVDGLL